MDQYRNPLPDVEVTYKSAGDVATFYGREYIIGQSLEGEVYDLKIPCCGEAGGMAEITQKSDSMGWTLAELVYHEQVSSVIVSTPDGGPNLVAPAPTRGPNYPCPPLCFPNEQDLYPNVIVRSFPGSSSKTMSFDFAGYAGQRLLFLPFRATFRITVGLPTFLGARVEQDQSLP